MTARRKSPLRPPSDPAPKGTDGRPAAAARPPAAPAPTDPAPTGADSRRAVAAASAPADPAPTGADAPREATFLLARPERRLLEAIARRAPAFVRPDHLTVLALAAAVAFAVSAATGRFGLAAALLVLHWFGDSLDGTLARVRRAERPRYGYYLDHLADAVATALIGLGLGLSAHMHLVAGLVLVVAYLALSINSYLETQALGRFSLGYGRLGPTEARLGLIALLIAIALGAEVSWLGLTLLDLAALGAAAAMAVAFFARAAGNLRVLAQREPYAAP
ncbi:MAG TPA: CDP-alcohol phosphatidyltransferase family protein [Solirubrobacter sp.]|nr:CDP-alcohol phosphatidyltransferase family protein [Solirubrobacter sp.]